uniref:Myozenin 3 n=1 Tax=Crocodylus porosus TaxID=8502 RepID=A0A7M4F575_CROPO
MPANREGGDGLDLGEGQGCHPPISEWGTLSRPPSATLQPYPLALSPPKADNSMEGTGTYHTELHIAPAAKGAPPQVPKKSSRVLQMSKALNPDNLAPGYTGPLKEVPPEKFNFTAIPKAYHSPWQEFLSSKDYQADSKSQLPETPKNLSNLDFRSFNRTPTPFGGPLINDPFPSSSFEMDTMMDTLNSLQLLSSRPSFNRAPRGWVQTLPETEEL